jgi:hypothetical protein
MALLDLWMNAREQVGDKHVQQLIAFAGDGKLLDGGPGSSEFRAFLSHIPTELLKRYASECLFDAFPNSGFALQDIVNEVGVRLGASVEPGRYRGTAGRIGHDGLWKFPGGHSLVVEVKTTDAYRIDLERIATYRKALVDEGRASEDGSSALIVVGRQDTGDLEAQIRGSRHAWSMRIISVDALVALAELKEEVEDPQIVSRIHQILIPREFTRLDEIVEVLFSTAEEVQQEEATEIEEPGPAPTKQPKFVPVAFHEGCLDRITAHLSVNLVKRSRAKYSTPDGRIAVNCAVSKEHDPDTQPNYWFAFHPHQKDFLENAETGYVAFGCGSAERLLLIPFSVFRAWIDGLWTTEAEDRFYWHVVIYREDGQLILHRKKGESRIDLTAYLVPPGGASA